METQLDRIEKELAEIKNMISQICPNQENSKKLIEKPPTPKLDGPSALIRPKSDEFEELKKLLESPEWPAAIDPELICDTASEQDKENRAEGIIDLILETELKGASFLDFGCGEGHIPKKIIEQEVLKSVGYDIKAHDNWMNWKNSTQSLMFSTNWGEIIENGPYDVIMLYDVIDHIMGTVEDVTKTLSSLKQIMHKDSQVFVRCHPFCSRHGTHLYQEINKAYIHLVFTEEELKLMGYEGMPTRRVIHPLMTYKQWFNLAGFELYKRDHICKELIEPFFEGNQIIANRIKKNWLDSPDENFKSGRMFPRMQLEQQFVDYILKE